MTFEVKIPDRLTPAHKDAIDQAIDRLDRATAAGDPAQVLGTAKDLLEATAKAVLQELGVAYPARANFGEVVNLALIELERHPEVYQGRQPLQRLASAFKQIASAIEDLRNHEGTGHGQPTPTDLAHDHAGFVADSALLWTKWLLDALDRRLAARDALDELIRDLDNFAPFRGGELAVRLRAVPMDAHTDDEIMRLGRALGRRRARGTRVVQALVIDPIVRGDLEIPSALVRGLVEGLFIDANGYVRVAYDALGSLIELAEAAQIDAGGLLREVTAEVEGSEASYAFHDADQARALAVLEDLRDQLEDGDLRGVVRDLGFAVLALRPSFLARLTVLWTGEGGNTRYELEWSPISGWMVIDAGTDERLSALEIGLPLDAIDLIHVPNRTLRIETHPPLRIVSASLVDPGGVELAPDSQGGGLPVDEWFVEFRNQQF